MMMNTRLVVAAGMACAFAVACSSEDSAYEPTMPGGQQAAEEPGGDKQTGSNDPCAFSCKVGQHVCSLDARAMECADNGEGCPFWRDTVCPEGTHCDAGECVPDEDPPVCTNECTPDARECVTTADGKSATRFCTDSDDDPCLEWSEPLVCDVGTTCSEGRCACSDECSVGTQECSGDGFRTCAPGPDGCGRWSAVTACAETCSDGQCTCKDECSAGARECSANGFRTCSTNADGCGRWSIVTACAETCSDGRCTCKDECSAGARECSANGFRTCGTNADGCGRWSAVTACSDGCADGQCKAPPTVVMAPTRYPGDRILSPITAYVAQSMKNIAAKNTSRNNSRFMKIGDSHMYSGSVFMYCFSKTGAKGGMNLNGNTFLNGVIDTFQSGYDSFNRDSVSAVLGKTAYWAVSGGYITSEMNAVNPRFAFYGYGTNDMGWFGYTRPTGSDSGYYATMQWYYRYVLQSVNILIPNGVIPMFIGTGVRTDKPSVSNNGLLPIHWVRAFDAIARGVAEAYQVPYLNLQLSQQTLPGYGLSGDGIHHKHIAKGCDFTTNGLTGGSNTRNRYAIEMLDRAWRAAVRGETAPDTIVPFEGAGSASKPWLIPELPFTHSANTKNATNAISKYTCSSANEAGPEYYYKLTLKKSTRIRAFSLSSNNTDVDIHLSTSTNGSCLARGDKWVEGNLSAGTYYFIVDTYSSSTNAGEYLFGIVECDSDDPLCGSSTTGG